MLKRIATALVLIPIVLFIILRAPGSVLAVVAGGVALATVAEFLKLTESYGVRPQRSACLAGCAIFFLVLAALSMEENVQLAAGRFLLIFCIAAAIAPFVYLSFAMRRAKLDEGYPAAAASVCALGYIALPLGMLVQLRQQNAGAFWVLYLLLVVWVGRCVRVFCRALSGTSPDVAAHQSEKNLGGRGCVGPGKRAGRRGTVPPCRIDKPLDAVAWADRAARRNVWT